MAEETEKISVEEGPAPKKAPSPKQKIAAAVGCALVVVGVVAGAAISAQQPQPAADEAVQEQAGPAEEAAASVSAEAEGWDFATATPLIAHVVGEGSDFYTSLGEGASAELPLAPGDYEVELVPSIGADGSLLKHEGGLGLHVSSEGGSLVAETVKVGAEDVSEEEMKAAVEAVAKAVEGGDSSLEGDAGREVLETARDNAAANPNMSEEAEEKDDEGAAGSGADPSVDADDAPTAAGAGPSADADIAAQDAAPSTGQDAQGGDASSSPSSSSSSSSGAPAAPSPSKPAHEHSWTAVTSQQWVPNAVSVWVQDSAAWDEPVYSGTYWCNVCGCAVSVDHVKETMLAGQGHSVTTKNVQTGTIHHEATGHYETQDQGRYETVTTGYQCSGCGAWQ